MECVIKKGADVDQHFFAGGVCRTEIICGLNETNSIRFDFVSELGKLSSDLLRQQVCINKCIQ
jgi:hypothetical protein